MTNKVIWKKIKFVVETVPTADVKASGRYRHVGHTILFKIDLKLFKYNYNMSKRKIINDIELDSKFQKKY